MGNGPSPFAVAYHPQRLHTGHFNETLLGFLFGDKWFKDAGILGVSSTASSTWPSIVHLKYTMREKFFKNIREYHLSLAQAINATVTDQVFTSRIATLFALMTQAAHKGDRGKQVGFSVKKGLAPLVSTTV